jgi:hypothetical protein
VKEYVDDEYVDVEYVYVVRWRNRMETYGEGVGWSEEEGRGKREEGRGKREEGTL